MKHNLAGWGLGSIPILLSGLVNNITNISAHFPKHFFKSPFSKGGFRGIIKGLIIIPPDPPSGKGGNTPDFNGQIKYETPHYYFLCRFPAAVKGNRTAFGPLKKPARLVNRAGSIRKSLAQSGPGRFPETHGPILATKASYLSLGGSPGSCWFKLVWKAPSVLKSVE